MKQKEEKRKLGNIRRILGNILVAFLLADGFQWFNNNGLVSLSLCVCSVWLVGNLYWNVHLYLNIKMDCWMDGGWWMVDSGWICLVISLICLGHVCLSVCLRCSIFFYLVAWMAGVVWRRSIRFRSLIRFHSGLSLTILPSNWYLSFFFLLGQQIVLPVVTLFW